MAVTCIYGECYRSSRVHETNKPAVRHNPHRAIHYRSHFHNLFYIAHGALQDKQPVPMLPHIPTPRNVPADNSALGLSAPLDILPCKHCQVLTQVLPGSRLEALQDMQPSTAATNQHQLPARTLYSAHMLPGSCCTATLDEHPAKTMPDNRSIAFQHRQTSITC